MYHILSLIKKVKRLKRLLRRKIIVLFIITGRKFPLRALREKLLRKQRQYIRVLLDEFYDKATKEEIDMEWNRLDVYPDDIGNFSANDLKSAQRTRMFSCWHDTSAISNASHFLVVFSCMYDKALFYTSEEHLEKTGLSYVEQGSFL